VGGLFESSDPSAGRKGADLWARLRTAAWRNGGRIAIAADILADADVTQAERFGLWVRDDRCVVSILEENLDACAPNLSSIARHDNSNRRLYASAPADAPLLRYSGHQRYRSETQKAAIGALLTMPPGASMMVSMPTGSGKSLLFQLGLRYWRTLDEGACAIVITPTIALAEDHKNTLRALPGLQNSFALVGGQDPVARQEALFSFRRGEAPVLFLSPEAALGASAADIVEAAQPEHLKSGLKGRLVAVFIDEAHIVESWGRTFRPDFQRLPGLVAKLREHNPELRTILLSATLDGPSRRHLRSAYGQGEWLEMHANAPRYEFEVSIGRFTDAKDRDEVLFKAIDRAPRPAIIYTTRVEDAQQLHSVLTRRGYARTALFTGETRPNERQRILDEWRKDEIDLVVATSAFGLGVDKANVRSVIHACLPENALRYYQEIGRAARDGKQGFAICLWTAGDRGQESDEACARSFASGSLLTREKAELRWEALKNSGPGGASPFRYEGATLRGLLSLNAARQGLGRHTGEPNRQWNMSLLNLLQRAGVIEIETVEDDSAKDDTMWAVKVREPQFLDTAQADAIWTRIYLQRDREQAEGLRAFSQFESLMREPTESCFLQRLYELVDPEAFYVPPCGRCLYCRRNQVTPPQSVDSDGLDQVWGTAIRSPSNFPAGISIVAPVDADFEAGLSGLLTRLVRSGLEQFIVAENQLTSAADTISCSRARFGLTQDLDAWLSGKRALPGIATALLLPAGDYERASLCLERARNFADIFAGTPFIIVADPSLPIDGRPLSQIASRSTAYHERDLDLMRDVHEPSL
jgi:ATP-dependent DNA helicase RecQ